MIEQEIEQAKQRKDWDTVQKLINIRQAEINLEKSQSEVELIELNKKVAEKSLEKMAVDIDKTLFDRKMAWWNWLLGSGIFVALINIAKDLPAIKALFK